MSAKHAALGVAMTHADRVSQAASYMASAAVWALQVDHA